MKRLLTIYFFLLGATCTNAQTPDLYIKDKNARSSAFKKHVRSMLDRQNSGAGMKTTALNERIIAQSRYELQSGSVPNIYDSARYVYSGTNGSKFNFNFMDFDNFFAPDFGPFDYPYDLSTLDVRADSARFWSKDSATGPLELVELTTAAFNPNNKLTSFGDYYFDMNMPDGADVYYHSYDAQGKLATITSLYDNGSGLDSNNKIVLFYNALGQHYQDSIYEYNGGLWLSAGVINYTFDAAANITSVVVDVKSLPTWTTVLKYENTFYSTNKLQTSTEYYFSGLSLLPGNKDSFGYDNNSAFATFQVEYSMINNVWEPQYRATKQLNTQGLPDTIFFETYSNLNWESSEKHVYTYTSYNNPLRRDIYQANGSNWDLSIIRHFYYEIYNDPNDVKEVAGGVPVKLYPNPAGNELKVSWENNGENRVSLSIINATGQEVLSTSLTWKPQAQSVNIRDLAPGLYWVIGRNETGRLVFRQAIQKQ